MMSLTPLKEEESDNVSIGTFACVHRFFTAFRMTETVQKTCLNSQTPVLLNSYISETPELLYFRKVLSELLNS